jgi:peptidoglycan/LPS O-acetylase OafA/YrhL
LVAAPLVWMGRRSYSIYMVHALIVLLAEYFVRGLGHRNIVALDSICPGLPATVNLVVSLGAVLAVSHLTYLYVEIPGGKLLRNVFRGQVQFTTSSEPSARPSN